MIKDEETFKAIDDRTVTLELISSLFAQNYTTSNGSLEVNVVVPTLYTIRFNAPDYNQRFYLFNLTNDTFNNITLYLLNSSNADNVTANVVDQANTELEGAVIKVTKYDIGTNTYRVMEIVQTNFEGQAELNLQKNTEFYRFILEFPVGHFRKQTNPTYIYEDEITFQINTVEQVGTQFFNTEGVTHTLSFDDATDRFTFTYDDPKNLAAQGCLEVYKITLVGNGSELVNSSCSSSSSGTVYAGVDAVNGTSYEAKTFVTLASEDMLLNEKIVQFKESLPFGLAGILGIALITIIFAVGLGAWNPVVALIITPIPLLFGVVVGLVDLGIGMGIGVFAACIVIAMMIHNRS